MDLVDGPLIDCVATAGTLLQIHANRPLAILLINGTIGLTYALIEYRYRRQVGPELLAPSPGAATAGPLNPKSRRPT